MTVKKISKTENPELIEGLPVVEPPKNAMAPEEIKYVSLTLEQYASLKQSGETALASSLNTLDQLDELLGDALNNLKTSMETDGTGRVSDLTKLLMDHAIQIFLRRYNIKMQMQNRLVVKQEPKPE